MLILYFEQCRSTLSVSLWEHTSLEMQEQPYSTCREKKFQESQASDPDSTIEK